MTGVYCRANVPTAHLILMDFCFAEMDPGGVDLMKAPLQLNLQPLRQLMQSSSCVGTESLVKDILLSAFKEKEFKALARMAMMYVANSANMDQKLNGADGVVVWEFIVPMLRAGLPKEVSYISM